MQESDVKWRTIPLPPLYLTVQRRHAFVSMSSVKVLQRGSVIKSRESSCFKVLQRGKKQVDSTSPALLVGDYCVGAERDNTLIP